MKTIYKYPFEFDDIIEISMPKDAEILCVQEQAGQPCIWALVETMNIYEQRQFKCYGTGHQIILENLKYIGTFQLLAGKFIGHLFEIMT